MITWLYHMRCFYSDDVEPPKRPGDLAIQTKHQSESSLIFEVQAAQSRKDIGKVEWWGPVSDQTRKLLEEKK